MARLETIHPHTLILTRETGFTRPYDSDSFADYVEYLGANEPPFSFGTTTSDRRLPAPALVVGISIGDVTRACPVDGLLDPINDQLSGEPVVIMLIDGRAAAFSAEAGGQTLVFERTDTVISDTATGSVWTAAGLSTSGELAGEQLQAIPARTTFWFAFVAAFPDVELFVG